MQLVIMKDAQLALIVRVNMRMLGSSTAAQSEQYQSLFCKLDPWVIASFPAQAVSAGKKHLVPALDSGEANVKFFRPSGSRFTWPVIDDIGKKSRMAREMYQHDTMPEADSSCPAFAADLQNVIHIPTMNQFKSNIFTSRLVVFNATFSPVVSRKVSK
ncbi:hypothetical protein RRG08_046143 [Elysia crispata]|uniref:Uncharacterized protein n=1 Tax=Elysia crispata TaxID=231223 RepID=A0AAE1A3P0_9GAST|nr:hypothetical protein RRG08_046143 [Elysia crispata]